VILTRPARRPVRVFRTGRIEDAQRGATPLEFAIIAGAMLLLAFTVIQVSLVFWAQSIALGAATQGANAARGYHSSARAGESRARDFLANVGGGLLNQQVTARRSGTEASVTVRGRAASVLPGLSFTVQRTARGPVERVTAP